MATINEITQLTKNRFVNLYNVKGENIKGHHSSYYVASRAKTVDELKITTRVNHADGVGIFSLYGEKKDRVVLIRQYRYPIDDYIYEFPAGLVEKGESFREAAIREMREETGLILTPIDVDPMYEAPRFTTIGMTDEAVATVYGYASGEVSDKYNESSEEIEVIIADRDEVRRILREEYVSQIGAALLMRFIHDEDPFAFMRDKR